MTTARRAAAGLLVLGAVGAGVAVPPDPRAALVVPTVGLVAVALLVAGRSGARRTAPASGVVAVVSLAVTAWALASGRFPREPDAATTVWLLLEVAVLAVFVHLPVRWARPHAAAWAGGLTGLAAAVVVLRFDVPWSLWTLVAVCALWAVPSLAAALAAFYLRGLETARHRAVQEARREQRLELAGDLHDFVAHDVSAMVAQAQAGVAVLGGRDPAVAEVLRRIEAAGLRSLASMDRTIEVLHGEQRAPVGVLADVPGVLRTWDAAAVVDLDLDPATAELPREVSAVAYRVVVESLTNVRRHAAHVRHVTVAAHHRGAELHVTVTDDGRTPGRAGRDRGGRGLVGLAARVEALGGTFRAGPRGEQGWRVEATLPAGATAAVPS
ncbi:sensor histidine kinase [Cellulomonas sp. NPDC057328]|uniref:sensor histidine kinase n=1 Tax=Cellulomonas sp. NPDC057328 TaxID=3346101 RepID=UPI00362997FC